MGVQSPNNCPAVRLQQGSAFAAMAVLSGAERPASVRTRAARQCSAIIQGVQSSIVPMTAVALFLLA
jgi:hypothetical protein